MRNRIAENGLRLVREKYQWPTVVKKLEAVYQGLTDGDKKIL
jgi:hypothetical protein